MAWSVPIIERFRFICFTPDRQLAVLPLVPRPSGRAGLPWHAGIHIYLPWLVGTCMDCLTPFLALPHLALISLCQGPSAAACYLYIVARDSQCGYPGHLLISPAAHSHFCLMPGTPCRPSAAGLFSLLRTKSSRGSEGFFDRPGWGVAVFVALLAAVEWPPFPV